MKNIVINKMNSFFNFFQNFYFGFGYLFCKKFNNDILIVS